MVVPADHDQPLGQVAHPAAVLLQLSTVTELPSQSAARSDPWRDYVVSPWSWRPGSNQAGALVFAPKGEAGGLFVACDALGGCRSYLKPLRRPNHGNQVRAAREKIVSDIAHDLGVSVPPVLLYDRGGGTPSHEEQYVCISRVMFPRQMAWQQVKELVVTAQTNDRSTMAVMAALPVDAAMALALDAWVGQPDHNDHPHNIVFGYTPSATPSGRFIFLDYAWSLGYHGTHPLFGWEQDGWKNTECPPFPPHMLRFMDKATLRNTVTKIEDLNDQTIAEVVERIPPRFLLEPQRRTIFVGLLGRKTMVRQILNQHLTHS